MTKTLFTSGNKIYRRILDAVTDVFKEMRPVLNDVLI